MKEFIESIIATGNYVLSEMETRIEKMYVLGKLTTEELEELLTLAAENAKDAVQIDVAAKLADLESRIAKLEAKGVVVWTQGHVTANGETVLYDVNKDGTLEYCRYDGGRASTALSPGKIEGWVVLDAEGGQVIGTLQKDESGKVIIVPVVIETEENADE